MEKNEPHISVVARAIHEDKILFVYIEKLIFYVFRRIYVLITFTFLKFLRQFNLIITNKKGFKIKKKRFYAVNIMTRRARFALYTKVHY